MSMPAFDEASLTSQAAFRAVMETFARPGTACTLQRVAGPSTLAPATASLIRALADYETPVWLDASLADDRGIRDWIRFETGAPVTTDPAEAAFALLADAQQMPSFAGFALGTPDYPDRSTTIIVQVEGFDGAPIVVTGPGIKTTATISPQVLPPDFAERWADNHQLFPRGVDLVLAAGDRIVALPRSVRLRKEHS